MCRLGVGRRRQYKLSTFLFRANFVHGAPSTAARRAGSHRQRFTHAAVKAALLVPRHLVVLQLPLLEDMTAEEMEVESMEAMEDSGSTSSSEDEGSSTGEAEMRESNGQEEMEGSDEEGEEKAANPEFSKFMQGFWDLASVDVPVRYCCGA